MPLPAIRTYPVRWVCLFFVLVFASTACNPSASAAFSTSTLAPASSNTAQPSTVMAQSVQTPQPTATPAVPLPPVVWLEDYLPTRFLEALNLPTQIKLAHNPDSANLRLEIWPGPSTGPAGPGAYWIYAAATAFPSGVDAISIVDIRAAWQGEPTDAFGDAPLLVDPETYQVMTAWLGPANTKTVQVKPAAELLGAAWKTQPSFSILPFEDIQPRWKILRVDGQSPLDNTFDAAQYPLAVQFEITGSPQALAGLPARIDLPTNRDPEKLTVLVMTGVTALSRHIGEVMEARGGNYPARDIGPWLESADLTHISNEVSFYTDCPKPGPLRADMRFCSNPKYIELLETVGTDIIELTGNHNLDWGIQPYLYTLDLYDELGWGTYGGGKTLEDALEPLLVEHNGNRLAFIGCSPAGPEKVWATADKPGSAPCNMNRLERQIADLAAQGYLPIVTFQAVETDTYLPAVAQGMPDFRRMARSGAVIVSGSQSHIPQTMTFVQSSFVHYGLGNLFFDQMEPDEMRQAFIDRHIFYDGKYMGVELLTTLLEEYGRPRPMTDEERASFLEEIFALCTWDGQ